MAPTSRAMGTDPCLTGRAENGSAGAAARRLRAWIGGHAPDDSGSRMGARIGLLSPTLARPQPRTLRPLQRRRRRRAMGHGRLGRDLRPRTGSCPATPIAPRIGDGWMLTPAELAAYLSISVRQVQRLRAAGMPATPVGARSIRYDHAQCMAWLQANQDSLCHTASTPAADLRSLSASAARDYTDACRRAQLRVTPSESKPSCGLP